MTLILTTESTTKVAMEVSIRLFHSSTVSYLENEIKTLDIILVQIRVFGTE